MPEAHLYQGDFTVGLAKELTEHQYDAIIATYSLHHLSDVQKVEFLSSLLELLKPNGCIYMGDVAFHTRDELEMCRRQMAEMWDEDEIYFVFEELKHSFPQMEFEQVTYCSGILCLKKCKVKALHFFQCGAFCMSNRIIYPTVPSGGRLRSIRCAHTLGTHNKSLH